MFRDFNLQWFALKKYPHYFSWNGITVRPFFQNTNIHIRPISFPQKILLSQDHPPIQVSSLSPRHCLSVQINYRSISFSLLTDLSWCISPKPFRFPIVFSSLYLHVDYNYRVESCLGLGLVLVMISCVSHMKVLKYDIHTYEDAGVCLMVIVVLVMFVHTSYVASFFQIMKK